MIILDTDCLSLLQRRRGNGYLALVDALSKFSWDEISTTIVSFDEQMRGWMALVARAKTTEIPIASLRSTFETFMVRPLTSDDQPFNQDSLSLFLTSALRIALLLVRRQR